MQDKKNSTIIVQLEMTITKLTWKNFYVKQ